MTFKVTSLSSKGQVVIPRDIREKLRLTSGSNLLVMTDGSNLLLKPIDTPSLQTFEQLVKDSKKLVSQKKLKKSEVAKLIRSVRHESRSWYKRTYLRNFLERNAPSYPLSFCRGRIWACRKHRYSQWICFRDSQNRYQRQAGWKVISLSYWESCIGKRYGDSKNFQRLWRWYVHKCSRS